MSTSPDIAALFPLTEQGFAHLCGLVVDDVTAEAAHAHVVVGAEHLQPGGVVHGGVYASIAESLASVATYVAVAGTGKIVMGQANDTSFLRPITGGTLHATARKLHGGRTTWVWDVECTDDAGRRCAVTRMTIAVRDAPPA